MPILAIAAIGLLWEAFEWNIDQIVLSRFSNDPVDTLSDLGAGIAGALTYAFFLSGRASKDRGIKDSEFAND